MQQLKHDNFEYDKKKIRKTSRKPFQTKEGNNLITARKKAR